MAEGIRTRHQTTCHRARDKDARCSCRPSYRATLGKGGKGNTATFATEAAARQWRTDQLSSAARAARAPVQATEARTVRQAAEEWIELAHAGVARTRSHEPFKPSVLRLYASALEQRILPDLGSIPLAEVRRRDVQDLADRLIAEGLSPSRVRNILMPLRNIYARAVKRDEVALNPTSGVDLPPVRGVRDRTADAEEMLKLLAPLEPADRAVFSTAFYSGLRLGELQALAWADVELSGDLPTIRVEHSWDPVAGLVSPKSRAGVRSVPVVDELRSILRAHQIATGRRGGLVFGRSETRPFDGRRVSLRARKAWASAGLTPIGLHEGRHSFVSLFHDAGVSLDRISDYAGHASAGITHRYRHLSDPRRTEDLALVNAYLAKARGEHAEAAAR